MKTTTFTRVGPNGRKYRFKCEAIILGIPVNPVLPTSFDVTPNDLRNDRQLALWDLPFLRQTKKSAGYGSNGWEVRCLDGGAWDRSTWIGSSPDKDRAVLIALADMATSKPYVKPEGVPA